MIDLHCHLDLFPDPVAVADRCRLHDIYVLSVTTTPSAWPRSRQLSQAGDRIRVALGLHPQLAHERKSELGLFDELLAQTRYVGEVGLDGGPELRAYQSQQEKVFDHILSSCSKMGGKILSLHSRRAARPVIDAITKYSKAGAFILHWFSGTSAELKDATSRGCWFSVGPSMLQSKKGRQLVSQMPRERILTETDGPFAREGDVPLMPWDVAKAEALLADIWGVPLNEARANIKGNFRTLVS